jgi:hypothetical protein
MFGRTFGLAVFVKAIPLSPLANAGFTADRTALCPKSNPKLHSTIFCPNVNLPPGSTAITKDQGPARLLP